MTDKNKPERKRIREWIKDRTGFFAYTDPKGEYHRGKTLWDWLQLLVIPAVFAGVGYLFNSTNDIRQEGIAVDRQREEALQSYIDGMENLLLDEKLRASEDGSEVRAVAQARTFTVLRGLDGERRGVLLLFLYDAGLIGYETPDDPGISVPSIISLKDANLSGAVLQRAYLLSAVLPGANLSGANLTGAYLMRAALPATNLTGAYLGGANLTEAILWGADLTGADLTDADLGGANLWSADLKGANLTGADLTGADLRGADLKGANLTGADLTGADLRGVDLSSALLRGTKIDISTVLGEEQRKLFEAVGVTAEPGEE